MSLWGNSKTALKSVTLTSPGAGYTAGETAAVTIGAPVSGTAATGAVIMGIGGVDSIVLGNFGAGYTGAPAVTITAPASGTAATAVANMGLPSFAKSGGEDDPANMFGVTVGDKSTTDPFATCGWVQEIVVSGGVASIILSTGGSGYTAPPTVSFTPAGTGGTGAAAVATETGGVVTTLELTNAGSGYTAAPSVVFTPAGTGGTGAAATTTVSDAVGRVKGETLVAMGSMVA